MSLRQTLAAKSRRYWLLLGISILVGMHLGRAIGGWPIWIGWRYGIFRHLADLNPIVPHARDTALLLVSDNDFWTSCPADLPRLGIRPESDTLPDSIVSSQQEQGCVRRTPIRRDYLALLVRKLATVEPSAIVIDFDLRSPVPDQRASKVEVAEYALETRDLASAILEVSQKRYVIVPRTITCDGTQCKRESDILDDFNLGSGKIAQGFVQLFPDKRMIPLSVQSGGENIESIALAAARTKGGYLQHSRQSLQAFGSFLDSREYATRTVNVTEFLQRPEEFRAVFAGQIVIIGGSWHESAVGRGSQVDLHETPIGMLSGSMIHANYIEALLDGRVYSPTSEWVVLAMEALLSLGVAICVLGRSPIIGVFGTIAAACFISYVAFVNFGIVFDFLVPLVIVIGHTYLQQAEEWRKDSRRLHELESVSLT